MTKSIQKALIFTGGYCHAENLSRHHFVSDLIIAADAGRLLAEKCGVTPDLIVGDFDSSSIPSPDSATEILRVPAEKDETDTMLACRIAMERGATDLLILGGTGGRADHSLSNFFLLEHLRNLGAAARLFDGDNRLRILRNETITLPQEGFRYFSLFALDDAIVSLSGCKYPLSNAPLIRSMPYAVSNEFTEAAAIITVSGGDVFLVESEMHKLS